MNPLLVTAFYENQLLASGSIEEVALKLRKYFLRNPDHNVLIFDDHSGNVVDLDLRGNDHDILLRLKKRCSVGESIDKPASGPGRPKLGVACREVSLLPQHWDWLATQPGGASASLRRLVEDSKKKNREKDLIRAAQTATHRFMTATAGDLPHYEEALRELYALNETKFKKLIGGWPTALKKYASKLAKPIWQST